MGLLAEFPIWSTGIRHFEANAPLTGGPDCPDNLPLSDLVNRTAWLYVNKAPLDSPEMTGTPKVPTATSGTSTTQAASTEFVQSAVLAAQSTELGAAAQVGSVIYYAMPTAPAGYLKANGAAVSRSTYAALFAAIGTTFGVGDGATTFNVPDLRGEFVRGWDDWRGVDSGRSFGSAQADELKSHTHTYNIPNTVSGSGYPTGATAGVTTPNTGATGGTETRPRNIALLACIKY